MTGPAAHVRRTTLLALAVALAGCGGASTASDPTATATATSGVTGTSTPATAVTQTATASPTPTPTLTPTATASPTPTPTLTATDTPVPVDRESFRSALRAVLEEEGYDVESLSYENDSLELRYHLATRNSSEAVGSLRRTAQLYAIVLDLSTGYSPTELRVLPLGQTGPPLGIVVDTDDARRYADDEITYEAFVENTTTVTDPGW